MEEIFSENGEHYQLRIESKKLCSGKCQVKFYLANTAEQNMYGYTLVESGSTLKDVVIEIRQLLDKVGRYENYYQSNLFSISRTNSKFRDNFVLFKD